MNSGAGKFMSTKNHYFGTSNYPFGDPSNTSINNSCDEDVQNDNVKSIEETNDNLDAYIEAVDMVYVQRAEVRRLEDELIEAERVLNRLNNNATNLYGNLSLEDKAEGRVYTKRFHI